jgi:hypothetical protein
MIGIPAFAGTLGVAAGIATWWERRKGDTR